MLCLFMAKQAKNRSHSGRFAKGAPSPNPLGRGAPFKRADIDIAKAAGAQHAPGTAGVLAFGGFVQSGERSPKLNGRNKWVEYANAPIRSAPVAISMLLRWALFHGIKWSLTENPSGGKAAKKGLDVCQRGLLDARMPTPWRAVAAKAQHGRYFYGFSIHATAIARRKDSLVTYTEIEHRPQHTVFQWLRKSPTEPFTSIVQRTDDGQSYPIDLADCFYLRNQMLNDGPEGQGVLRLLVERISETKNYRQLEGTELFSGMGGTPIARAPLEEIAAFATGDEAAKQAYVDSHTSAIEDAVKNRIKSPLEQQYLKLDSATYKGSNPDTISAISKWGIEIVKAELGGLVEIRKVITDSDLDDARILGVEFAFIGGGDAKGTFSANESKFSTLLGLVSADADEIGEQGTLQLCRPLCEANGLDPDEACPTLVASPITTEDVEKIARTMGLLSMAGLTANHPAKPVMFGLMGMPWQEEPEPVLPRIPMPPERTPPPGDKNPKDAPPRDEPTQVEPPKEQT